MNVCCVRLMNLTLVKVGVAEELQNEEEKG